MSGLARAVTGKGMRELIREELAEPLNTDGLHLGRPPAECADAGRADHRPAGHAPEPGVQLRRAEAGRAAAGPAVFGALYFPGMRSVVQGDTPFLDGEIPAANGVATARGLAKMYGGAGQRRPDRRHAVPVDRAGRGPDRQAEPAAGPQHRLADGVPSRLPLDPDSRRDAGVRPRRPGWIARLGRSRQRDCRSASCTTGC